MKGAELWEVQRALRSAKPDCAVPTVSAPPKLKRLLVKDAAVSKRIDSTSKGV